MESAAAPEVKVSEFAKRDQGGLQWDVSQLRQSSTDNKKQNLAKNAQYQCAVGELKKKSNIFLEDGLLAGCVL